MVGVKFHNFQLVKEVNNTVLAKCDCCSTPRWGVFVINNGDKIFHYHGYDSDYAYKLFSTLSSRSQS